MSAEYAKAQRKKYLKETSQIRSFLAAPENIELLRMYESVADEFELKIIGRVRQKQKVDEIVQRAADDGGRPGRGRHPLLPTAGAQRPAHPAR